MLIEQRDEWEAAERRYFSSSSMLELAVMITAKAIGEDVMILPELTAA